MESKMFLHDFVKRQTRFVPRGAPSEIIANIKAVANTISLKFHTRNFKIYEVAPSLFMVDVRKAVGETLEYHKFYKKLCGKLENIIWRAREGMPKSELLRTMTL